MKKTIVLNLNEKEIQVLDDLSRKKGMNKTAVLRHALSLYQLITTKIENGEKIMTEDINKEKKELVLL